MRLFTDSQLAFSNEDPDLFLAILCRLYLILIQINLVDNPYTKYNIFSIFSIFDHNNPNVILRKLEIFPSTIKIFLF